MPFILLCLRISMCTIRFSYFFGFKGYLYKHWEHIQGCRSSADTLQKMVSAKTNNTDILSHTIIHQKVENKQKYLIQFQTFLN